MFSSNSFWCNDSWVICLEWLWCHKCVLVSWNKLSLIVGTSISDNDLWWVLIWHNHGWLWQSASESIWVIWLQWFLEHTSMKIFSYLKLILGQGSYFTQSLAVEINWLGSSIRECEANCLTILLENLAAWGNLCILEHGSGVSDFVSMDSCVLFLSSLESGSGCCFFLSLCRLGSFRHWHFIYIFL